MMTTYRSLAHLVIVLGLAVVTCTQHPPPPPAPVPQVGASCDAACEQMRALSCELGRDTAAGASCEQVCRNVMAGPQQVRWDLPCLAGAGSCSGCDPEIAPR